MRLATPRQSIDALLDPGSFVDIAQQHRSPWLDAYGIAAVAGDGVVVGTGAIAGQPVVIAAQDGDFMSGTLGQVHAACMCGAIRAARQAKPAGVVLMLDSAGVRLHEALAAELGLARLMREVFELRFAGVPCIAVINGRIGCFGGATLIAGCCDAVLMARGARFSLSGPRVLEAVQGRAFDTEQTALFTRIALPEHRLCTVEADEVLADKPRAVGDAIARALEQPSRIDAETLAARQSALEARLRGAVLPAQPVAVALPGHVAGGSADELLDELLGGRREGPQAVVSGCARIAKTPFFVVGAQMTQAVGAAQCVALSAEILRVMRDHRRRPILLLANGVQAVSLANEQFGLAGCLTHLAACIACARQNGHTVIALLGDVGTAGSFVVMGMLADALYALAGAQVHALPPRVVRQFVPHNVDSLATSTKVEDLFELGGVDAIWRKPCTSHLRGELEWRAQRQPPRAHESSKMALSVATEIEQSLLANLT
ncbi:MAG: carboxyl transferase domain-containing protein [Gammaproteobacteria bacterium]